MKTQLRQYFLDSRLRQRLRPGQLARLCGSTNVAKTSNHIIAFEQWGRPITADLLFRMADAMGIIRSTVEDLIEEDRREAEEHRERWLSEAVRPYLVVEDVPFRARGGMGSYNYHPLPDTIRSVQSAEGYAAQLARNRHVRCCLVLSRRISVWYAASGSIEMVTMAENGQPYNPYKLRIRSPESLELVDHDDALRQIRWPNQRESRDVTTDFGGVRLRSTFEIVDERPGQVTINIEGPFVEFPAQEETSMSYAWEITPDDVRTVLTAHRVQRGDEQVEELFSGLDQAAIEGAVLHYTDFDEQVTAMLREIEDQLLKSGTISGPRRY